MFRLETAIEPNQAKQMNPVVLAFVGDAVYTLYVREKLALSSDCKTGELNRRAAEKISARGQSELTDALLSRLTEEERGIFLRARNAKKPTKSKHATVAEYNRSTGFEAVVGFLYLTGQRKRIEELLEEIDADGRQERRFGAFEDGTDRR